MDNLKKYEIILKNGVVIETNAKDCGIDSKKGFFIIGSSGPRRLAVIKGNEVVAVVEIDS